MNARDVNSGRTVLAHVCNHLYPQAVPIVKLLLSCPNTDPNPVDNNGVSILDGYIDTWSTLNGPLFKKVDCIELGQRYDDIKYLLCDAGAIGAVDDYDF